MAGACQCVEVRIARVVEDGAFSEQGAESTLPMARKRLQVVGAHLVHDEHDNESWCALRLNTGEDSEQPECEQENYPKSFHSWVSGSIP
jgi:hypothetical protein